MSFRTGLCKGRVLRLEPERTVAAVLHILRHGTFAPIDRERAPMSAYSAYAQLECTRGVTGLSVESEGEYGHRVLAGSASHRDRRSPHSILIHSQT